jgi:hypothetical protein
MSRSGYSDGADAWKLIRWRGQVASSIRGKRGQAFLREMLEALDALPEKRLIANALYDEGEVCAIGSVGLKRGIANMAEIEAEDFYHVAAVFGVTHQLVREIAYLNDEYDAAYWVPQETPENRWQRMRDWVTSQLR